MDKIGEQPLCMYQYNNVFSGCRIPGVNTDFWKNFSDSKPQHIIVMSNNHVGVTVELSYFCFKVISREKLVTHQHNYKINVWLITVN